ncbi:hypothetical protein KKA01_00660, partial [Patescibacteria group bacterium]|nr:hypothetical protein [Patescibacteria group bacterium]
MAIPKPNTNQSEAVDPLVEALLEGKYISQTQYADAQEKSKALAVSVLQVISEENMVPDEEFAKVKSKVYGVPFMDLFGKMIRSDILNIISHELAQNYKMVAFNKEDNEVSIAMLQPNDFHALEAVEFLARKNQYKIKYYVTSQGSFDHVLKQYATLSEEVEQALKGTEAEAKASEEGIE